MLNLLKFIITLLLASFVAAQQLKINQPSRTWWWITNKENLLTWTCGTGRSFTVLLGNSNTTILPAPIAILAIQPDDQCSLLVNPTLSNRIVATGYTILFANIFNNTDVYATSDEFEIKDFNAVFPTSSSSATSSGAGPTPSLAGGVKPSGSISLKAGLGVISLAALGIVALLV